MQSFEAEKRKTKTFSMVFTGLLFAAAIVLSMIESQFPPVFAAVPGLRFGLSNVAVMFCLFCVSRRQAVMLAVMKALFVFITRGAIAGMLSLAGGLSSILVMVILAVIFKEKISYAVLSMFGAIFHNIGQFLVVSVLFIDIFVWAYLPVLILFGMAAGLMTSVLLRLILPKLQAIF